MPRTTASKFKSLREALLASCTAEPRPVKDVIADALKAHRLKGKTPAATASSELLRMQRAGLVLKPERGQVALAEAPAKPRRTRKDVRPG